MPASTVPDVRVWHFTPHGHYSVRSAYFLARQVKQAARMGTLGGTSVLNSVNWNWVWHLKIPNKIKVFLWRALRDSLPTRCALMRRGIRILLVPCVAVLKKELFM